MNRGRTPTLWQSFRIVGEDRTLPEPVDIAACLATISIDYERCEPTHPIAFDASSDEVLVAYGAEIQRLKQRGGYVTADVIEVSPSTP